MTAVDEGELLERYRRGDGRAFDEIVSRYEGQIYAIALRMCGQSDDARDVTQEVFVSAMRALRTFREEAQLSTWFHRVAVNASLDAIRRRNRRRAQPLEVVAEQPAADPGPDERAVAASRAAAVHRALGQISADHRAVLVLHDLQGLDYAEVAEALEIPVGTVKSRIHRARIEIAKHLGHLRETEPQDAAGPLKEDG